MTETPNPRPVRRTGPAEPAGAPPRGLLARWQDRLSLPLVVAPMFRVSGTALVGAACRAGAIGAFPTANCRSAEELAHWLRTIREDLQDFEQAHGRRAAPFAPNLIVHRSNPRVPGDLRTLLAGGVELVIASVGSPRDVIGPLHDAGCLVFTDVASVRHAQRAVEAGADGLILLTAGAGGQTGWANPFAFAGAIRSFYDGPIVMAGGLADGRSLFAASALGCDLGYMGTRFIASEESMAVPEYKRMLVASTLDDVLLTSAITGLPTSILRPSLEAVGLDPENLPERGAIDVAADISVEAREQPRAKKWKDIWSAGHSVSGVPGVAPAAAIIAELRAQYEAARRAACG